MLTRVAIGSSDGWFYTWLTAQRVSFLNLQVSEHIQTGEKPTLEDEIEEHLRSVKNPQERRTVAELLRAVSNLPLEHMRAAIETSASIAGVSLRASIEFLRATPEAARVLEPAELRAWGELGRRLTTNDVESGISFFSAGTADFARVPAPVRPFVLQVCSRQMILSAAIAAETFREAPALADAVADAELLRSIYEIAASISRRSAKHSAEFLSATPMVVDALSPNRTFSGGLPPAERGTMAGGSPPLNERVKVSMPVCRL